MLATLGAALLAGPAGDKKRRPGAQGVLPLRRLAVAFRAARWARPCSPDPKRLPLPLRGEGRGEGGVAVIQVQIRAADRARRDADDGVGRLLDRRIGHRFHPHIAGSVERDRFHRVPALRRSASYWTSAAPPRTVDCLLCGTMSMRVDSRARAKA